MGPLPPLVFLESDVLGLYYEKGRSLIQERRSPFSDRNKEDLPSRKGDPKKGRYLVLDERYPSFIIEP
jgi:hypothetical protein